MSVLDECRQIAYSLWDPNPTPASIEHMREQIEWSLRLNVEIAHHRIVGEIVWEESWEQIYVLDQGKQQIIDAYYIVGRAETEPNLICWQPEHPTPVAACPAWSADLPYANIPEYHRELRD